MRVVNLAGKTQHITVKKYLENQDLLIVRVISRREMKELNRLVKYRRKHRRDILKEISENQIESFLLE